MHRLQGSVISRSFHLREADCLGKDQDYRSRLDDALPDYVDFFFDNVGGEILDHMLTLVKRHGRIIVCGNISGKSTSKVSHKHD